MAPLLGLSWALRLCAMHLAAGRVPDYSKQLSVGRKIQARRAAGLLGRQAQGPWRFFLF